MQTLIGIPAGLVILATTAAYAEAAAGDESIMRIREAATAYVAAHAAPTARVEAAALDPRLRLPVCAQPLTTRGNQPAQRGAWSVAVSCESAGGGPAQWSIYVPVRISDLRPVAVLTRALPAGQLIPADAIAIESRDVGSLAYGYLDEPSRIVGQTLRRPLAPGSALTPDAIAAPAQIRRGALVTLVGSAGGVTIRAQGKALVDGGIGERINVENTGSHRVIDGVVRDGGTVDVGL